MEDIGKSCEGWSAKYYNSKERLKTNLGAEKELVVYSDISLQKLWKPVFLQEGKDWWSKVKWHWGKVNCCLIYGSHPEHIEHQGLLKYHASGISHGRGWLVCFWSRLFFFFQDDPRYCHFALSRETVCLGIVLNKGSNAEREKSPPFSSEIQ